MDMPDRLRDIRINEVIDGSWFSVLLDSLVSRCTVKVYLVNP